MRTSAARRKGVARAWVPGEVLLADRALRSVELDARRGRALLRCDGVALAFERIRATTLLGPWDGAPGTVEHVKLLAIEAGELCLEVRVRWATVPRVYRVVCGAIRRR